MNVFNDRVRLWFDSSAVWNIRRIPLLMLLGFFCASHRAKPGEMKHH